MKTKTTHTPGPWAIEYDNDTGPDDGGFWEWYDVGPARVSISRGHKAEATANAHLIAAAPELLEALRAMCSEFGITVEQAWDGIEPTAAERLARAAIAKAKGES